MYKANLIWKRDHSDVEFAQYHAEYDSDICPGGGDINWDQGVQCILHSVDGDSGSNGGDEDGADSVPFL